MIPKLLEKLGVNYQKLYCEPNGIFPHNPEPLAENLSENINPSHKQWISTRNSC